MAGENRKATPRVREHVERLRAAGMDTQRFFDALCAIRDDSALSKTHRDAITKLIAMESFIWYLEALRNEPIDREKLLAEARRITAEQGAAIAKKDPAATPGAALAQADIGKKPSPAPRASAAPPPPKAPTKK